MKNHILINPNPPSLKSNKCKKFCIEKIKKMLIPFSNHLTPHLNQIPSSIITFWTHHYSYGVLHVNLTIEYFHVTFKKFQKKNYFKNNNVISMICFILWFHFACRYVYYICLYTCLLILSRLSTMLSICM